MRNFFLFRLFRKYNWLLSREQRRRLPIAFFMMIMAGLFEMLSVSLMLPFMNIVVNRHDEESSLLKLYRSVFCLQSDRSFLIAISLTLAAVFILKSIFLVFQTRYQERFVGDARYHTQMDMLQDILQQPYEYFMSKSTSEIYTAVDYVSNVYILLMVLLGLFSESIISFMLILTLFIITPKISLLMASGLLLLLLLIARIIKPMIKIAADRRLKAAVERGKWLMQSIQGIKEVKIEKTERYFMTQYGRAGKVVVDADCSYGILSSIPRLLIETVIMSTFFVTIALHVCIYGNLSYMLPVISVIAMAALRLLPATNRISIAMNSISYYEPSLDVVIEYLHSDEFRRVKSVGGTEESTKSAKERENLVFYKDIKLDGVSYSYPGNDMLVLDHADMNISKGDTVGIVGLSGAGKTTLVDVLIGLLEPSSGKVTVDGVDIRKNLNEWLSIVGYIPQSIYLLDDSIRRNIAFGIGEELIDDELVWKALDEAAIGDFVRNLEGGLDTQIGERGVRLSGGQQQRLGIARALYREPQILILDEATSALDNETEQEIMKAVNELIGQKTIVIIAHRLTTIQSCNHIYRVESGKINKER